MKPYLSVFTLVVKDLNESLQFYCEGLGLQSEGILGQEFEYGAVALIELQANLKLALWPQSSLQQDTGRPSPHLCYANEFGT